MKIAKYFSLIIPLAVFSAAMTSHAGTHVWGGAVSGAWSNPANWSSGGAPAAGEAAPVVIQFPSTPSALRTNYNDMANLTVDVIGFYGGDYLVSSLAPITLKGGTPPFPYVATMFTGSSSTNRISHWMQFNLSSNVSFFVGNGGTLTMAANLTGPGGFTKTGAGKLILDPLSDNNFQGAATLLDGATYSAARYYSGPQDWFGMPVVTIPKTLNIGDTNMSHSPTLLLFDEWQLSTNTAVNMFANGTLWVGEDTGVRSLTMNGGDIYFVGEISVYQGGFTHTNYPNLYCGTNLTSNFTPFSTATIHSGNLLFDGQTTNFTFINVTAGNLIVNANMNSWASLVKVGVGQLSFGGIDSCGDTSVVQQGTFAIFNDYPFDGYNYPYSVIVSNGAQVSVQAECDIYATLHLNGFGVLGFGGALIIQHDNVEVRRTVSVDSEAAVYISYASDTAIFGDNFNGTPPFAGAGPLYKKGLGTLRLTGWSTNKFTGAIFVDQGPLELYSSAISGPWVVGHNVSDGTTAELRMVTDKELSTNSTVTLNASGTLNLDDTDQNAGPIILSGGNITTFSGVLTLYGDVLATNGLGSLISGTVALAGGKRAFHIAPNYGVNIYASLTDIGAAGFDVDGGGLLTLSSANPGLSGPINLKSGVLYARADGALGNGPGGLTIADGARLAVDGRNLGTEPITLNGDGNGYGAISCSKTNTISGPVTLATNTTINVVNANDRLTFGSSINGPGSLTKIGLGALRFSGNVANGYNGSTMVTEGSLELAKSGVIAVPGALVIGDAASPYNSHFVRVLGSNQIDDSAMATINHSGVLDLTGAPGSTDTIAMIAGNGNLNLGSASLTVGYHDGSGVFEGVVDGTSFSSLVKTGTGTLTLLGTSGNWAGATTINGGTLTLNGAQPSCDLMVNNGAKLTGNGKSHKINSQGGIFSPGLTAPNLQFYSGNVTLNSSTILMAQLKGTNAGVSCTTIKLSGTVSLGNATLNTTLAFAGAVGSKFMLVDNDGNDAITGTFKNLPEGGTFTLNGALFQISYVGGTGNDVVLTQLSSATPPGFTSIQNTGGMVQLSGIGMADASYSVQASTNLGAINWMWIGTAKAGPGGVISFTDTNSGSFPVRFYRLLAQ